MPWELPHCSIWGAGKPLSRLLHPLPVTAQVLHASSGFGGDGFLSFGVSSFKHLEIQLMYVVFFYYVCHHLCPYLLGLNSAHPY